MKDDNLTIEERESLIGKLVLYPAGTEAMHREVIETMIASLKEEKGAVLQGHYCGTESACAARIFNCGHNSCEIWDYLVEQAKANDKEILAFIGSYYKPKFSSDYPNFELLLLNIYLEAKSREILAAL